MGANTFLITQDNKTQGLVFLSQRNEGDAALESTVAAGCVCFCEVQQHSPCTESSGLFQFFYSCIKGLFLYLQLFVYLGL